MDRYYLVILSENRIKDTDKDEMKKRYESLTSSAKVLFQSLLKTSRESSKPIESNEQDSLCNFDPLLMLNEKSSQSFFSIVTGPRISEHLQQDKCKKFALLNKTLWHRMRDVQCHLMEFVDNLDGIIDEIHRLESQSDKGVDSEMDSESEFMAENIHNLADELPPPGSAVLDVYWLISGELDCEIRSHLCLYGALKRLQVFHRASITVLHDSQQDGGRVMASWRKNLDIQVVNNGELDGVLDPYRIWHGSLSWRHPENDSIISKRGFCLSYQNYEHNASQRQKLQDLGGSSSISISKDESYLYLAPELCIIKQVDKWALPLHVFVPLKLKLYLCDESSTDSRELWEKLIKQAGKDTAILGCFSCKLMSNTEGSKVSWEDWVNHLEQQTSNNKKENLKLDRDCMRMCLLCADGQGAMNVFPLKLPHHFNGGLLEYLAVAAATNGTDSSCQDDSFHLPDLTESFLETENELQRKQALHFQQCRDIFSGLCGAGSFESETFYKTVADEQWQNVKDFRLKALNSNLRFLKLKEEKTCIFVPKSELDMDPKEWPERIWLYENGSDDRTPSKRKNSQSTTGLASSLSIKDILNNFLADGRPRKKRLSPLKRKGKENKDEKSQIDTTLDSIKQMDYQEALKHHFHGVDYCLDTVKSLANDSIISTVNSAILMNETLSSHVTPRVTKLLASHTGRPVNKRRGTRRNNGLTCGASNLGTEIQGSKRSLSSAQRAPKNTNKQSKQTTESRVLKTKEANRGIKRKRESPTGTEKHQKQTKMAKTDNTQKDRETRSQRHKRRLQLVVDKSLEQHGVGKDTALYQACSTRLFGLCKSFLKDLHSSHGLKEEMKRIAESNVLQVVQFEIREHNLRMEKLEKS